MAVDLHTASCARNLSREQRKQGLTPRSGDPRDPDDLAGADLQVDAVEIGPVQFTNVDQYLVAGGACATATLHDLVADHQLDQAIVVERLDTFGGDTTTVTEHRHLVGDLEHLVEVVRHVEDGHAALLQTANRLEQVLDVASGQ